MTESYLENGLASYSSSGSGGSFFTLAVSVFVLVCMWKVFEKAGKEGWKALIPIYNVVVLFQICDIDPKVLLWLLLPIVGWIIYLVYAIKSYFALARKFGKPSSFGWGLLLLNVVFMAILAFDNNCQYVG